MAPEDLRVYTQLSTANITQRMAVPYSGSFEVIRYRLKQIYESVEPSTEESDVPALIVHERVTVSLDSENHVTLQWSSDPVSDMVSDSVVAMILNIGRGGSKVVPVEEAVKMKEETERIAQKVVHGVTFW
uniref:Pre-mRNA 3'-end-processing endonuclease polyadenylation factor C-term domain-containing protein n=1 Tax=Arundo donax TaxID=35708 RepID=A0A0A9GL79_ARUDO